MRTVVDLCQSRLGEDHPRTAVSRNNLAVILAEEGRHRQAAPLYRAALPTYEDAFSVVHPRVVKLKASLSRSLMALGRYASAGSLLTATHQALAKRETADSSTVALLHDRLAQLQEAQGHPKRATAYRRGEHSW